MDELANDADKSEVALQIYGDQTTRDIVPGIVVINPTTRKERWVHRGSVKGEDANIRITGIRIARLMKKDILPVATKLVKDPSPQVRRELIIALRGKKSVEAARLWTDLALQYDGKDRWYLEALGIGADKNWDQYFSTWKQQVGDDWSNRQTVISYGSRSKHSIPSWQS